MAMQSKIKIKGYGWILLGGLYLLSNPGYSERDPLFGDLPGRLAIVDQVLQDVGARERFGELIGGLSNRIASESSISGINPGGFSYQIGPLGLPEKTSSNLGSIWTYGADPVGENRLSIGVNYTYLDFDSFEGHDLNDFLDYKNSNPPIDINLDLKTHILGFSALYGVQEDWEIGLFVPFVFHESRGDLFLGSQWVGDANGSTEGLGDLLALSKYRIVHKEKWSWSLVGRIKLPTGDEDRYLGTGKWNLGVQSVINLRFDPWQFNGDFGYTCNGQGSKYDTWNYRAGLTYGMTDSLTLVGELIGSHSRESIFNTTDVGFGLKYNPYGGLVVQGGIRIPLDPDNSLRADWVPTIGLEWRF